MWSVLSYMTCCLYNRSHISGAFQDRALWEITASWCAVRVSIKRDKRADEKKKKKKNHRFPFERGSGCCCCCNKKWVWHRQETMTMFLSPNCHFQEVNILLDILHQSSRDSKYIFSIEQGFPFFFLESCQLLLFGVQHAEQLLFYKRSSRITFFLV